MTDAELAMHDELLARRNVDVWIGAEPTFTRADSMDPPWLSAAEGDDKLERAYKLALALAEQLPGARVSRVLGRQYPDEAAPRFAPGVDSLTVVEGNGETVGRLDRTDVVELMMGG